MGIAASKQEAFWEACGYGYKNAVQQFINDGIDVNWVSYTHNSCAIHVASQGKAEIVKMLIDAHCDVNAKDDGEALAIHHAAMRGHGDIIRMLLTAGSQINVQDKNGWSPLLRASYWCQPDAVEMLLEHSCNVKLKNKDERTALHEVCRSPEGGEEVEDQLANIAKLLIESGCNVNAKSSDLGEADFTPLMFAAYHGHHKVVQVLLEANCELNAVGTNGWSALHWAADRNRKEVVQILLDAGIDYMLKGRRDDFAVDRAKDKDVKNLIIAAMGDKYDPKHQIREPVAVTQNGGDKTVSSADFVKKMLLPNGMPIPPQPRTPRKRREIPMASALGKPPPPPEALEEKPVETLKQAWDAIPMADDESDEEQVAPPRPSEFKVIADEVESSEKDTVDDSDSGVDTPTDNSDKSAEEELKIAQTPETPESECYPLTSESASLPSEAITPNSEVGENEITSDLQNGGEKVPNGTPEVEVVITDNGTSSDDVDLVPVEGKSVAPSGDIQSADSLDDILANNIDEVSLGEI